jgi:nucleoside-diphosphate-sugar epimerase
VYSIFRDTKKASEKPVRGNNLEWTVFRPAPMYGPGDQRFLGPTLRKIEKGETFDVPGDGKIKIGPVHAADVAEVVANTIANELVVDAVYHFCGEGVAYDEVLRNCGAIVGKAPKIQHSSLALKERWLAIQDLFTKDPAKKVAISLKRNDYRYFLKDHLYPCQDTRDQVGFNPRPFAQGVKEACAQHWWK